MRRVKSTAVTSIGYGFATRELVVKFAERSAVYLFVNVPLWKCGAIFRSKSKGKALHKWILHDLQHRDERRLIRS